jgi:signal peptidase I
MGESMDPTYRDQEMVVVQNLHTLGKGWAPSRWDVVIIRDEGEGEDLSKRVVGLEGETIEIKSGYIYLDGKKIQDPYGREERISFMLVDDNHEKLHVWGTDEQAVEYADENKITVPKGYVWLIGDNRSMSWYGILPIKGIKALVIF